MTSNGQISRVLQAIDALKIGDRHTAVALLSVELQNGASSGERWRSISKLAFDIGAIDIGLEASLRFSRTTPITLERLLHYWGDLASQGRTDIAEEAIRKLTGDVRDHPSVAHFLGTIAGQKGDFASSEKYYRTALDKAPYLPQTWFALAMIKTFRQPDRDLSDMESMRTVMSNSPPELYARFLYALAKAKHDIGEIDSAFAIYTEGANLRGAMTPYNSAAVEQFSDSLIRDFTKVNMAKLRPAIAEIYPSIFVNGLPRSGTTLVEQILTSHSKVADGAEVNLFRAALIPTRNYTFDGALNYQERAASNSDPWGDIARDYSEMLSMRFQSADVVVDKTLSQSHFMGLIMHTLPTARVIWLRRDPEDTALSCFRNFFSSAIPWSWSLTDIAHYFQVEDRLYNHWTALYPERILTVGYEDLVRNPNVWIPKILKHAGLTEEPQVYNFHQTSRSVRTASVQQVRSPIATDRINSANVYESNMAPFRAAYTN